MKVETRGRRVVVPLEAGDNRAVMISEFHPGLGAYPVLIDMDYVYFKWIPVVTEQNKDE